MTNGALIDSLALSASFFLVRIVAIVIMPTVIVLFIVNAGRKLLRKRSSLF
jgi:hypothetical protein